MYSIEEGTKLAKQYALKKFENNMLFNSGDEIPVTRKFNYGFPETIYSIASLYGQHIVGDVDANEKIIVEYLLEMFPDFN